MARPRRYERVLQVVGYQTPQNELVVEALWDGKAASLAVRRRNGTVAICKRLIDGKTLIEPMPVEEGSPIAQGAVLLPSRPQRYGNKDLLIKLIVGFIHDYLQVDAVTEQLLAYYVLLTWRFHQFGSLPYLRFYGDWGTGKSRALDVVGSICYRPMRVAGALGAAPIFRMVSRYGGTLVLDEADGIDDEVVKVLNCGYRRGRPVIRCDGERYEPKAYDTYGPKIIATRHRFHDPALESRCLTILMQRRTRVDIPVTLPPEFWRRAQMLRNFCLSYRFDHMSPGTVQYPSVGSDVEPRLEEICASLKSVVGDKPAILAELDKRTLEIQEQLRQDGTVSLEGHVIRALDNAWKTGGGLSMERIACLASKELGYTISAQRVGKIARSFGLDIATPKGRVSIRQDAGNMAKLEELKRRYNIK